MHEVATICTLPLFPGKMATTWLSIVCWICCFDLQSTIWWVTRFCILLHFRSGKTSGFISIVLLTGQILTSTYCHTGFCLQDFPEQNHYTFLCNLQVFVQAFFSYYCSTILSREWWFSCTNNYTMLVSTLWDFYTSSFIPVFMQASRPSLSWTWIQFWSMMKRYKIHSLMTPGNIRTQVERWRKTWDCSKR